MASEKGIKGRQIKSPSSSVSLDGEPHSPVSLPDSDVTALLESQDFDLSNGSTTSVPIPAPTTRMTSRSSMPSVGEEISQLSGDKKRRWRPDDDIVAQSFLPLAKRPKARIDSTPTEERISVTTTSPKGSSEFIRYSVRPTLFEQFSAKDLEWCRYVRRRL
jgi:hypothetical protein